MNGIAEVFDSRFATLPRSLGGASENFGHDGRLSLKLGEDMFPLGTQIEFTCNQPNSFVQGIRGEEAVNIDREVINTIDAKRMIAETRVRLADCAGSAH